MGGLDPVVFACSEYFFWIDGSGTCDGGTICVRKEKSEARSLTEKRVRNLASACDQ